MMSTWRFLRVTQAICAALASVGFVLAAERLPSPNKLLEVQVTKPFTPDPAMVGQNVGAAFRLMFTTNKLTEQAQKSGIQTQTLTLRFEGGEGQLSSVRIIGTTVLPGGKTQPFDHTFADLQPGKPQHYGDLTVTLNAGATEAVIKGGPSSPVIDYVEAQGKYGSTGDKQIFLHASVTPKTADKPAIGEAVAKGVVVEKVRVDLLVDTNRDGMVDDKDEPGKAQWTKARGAIFMTNYDDDGKTGHSDAIEFDEQGQPINEGTQIQGGDDVKQIAPLVVRATGVKKGFQFFLRMDSDELKGIHIFEKRATGAKKLWGGWKDFADAIGQQEKDITDFVSADADVDLGIESLFLAGMTFTTPAGDFYEFNGQVTIELVVQATQGAKEIVSSKVVGTDKVRLKVAPYVALPNTQNAQNVWMLNQGSAATIPGSGPIGARDLAKKFGKFATPVSSVPPANSVASQWFQDHVQIGYTAMPGAQMHLTVRLPYPVLQDWPVKQLLKPGSGVFLFKNTIALGESNNSGDFGGNLEVVPPSFKFPLGRIIVGSTMSRTLRSFLEAQEVQQPFQIDTSWLRVGHVDELVMFVPGGPRGFRVAVASPEYALQLLSDGAPKQGIPKPSPDTAVFLDADAKQASGTSSTAIRTEDKLYLFDGAANGYVKVVPAAKLKDEETVTISDGKTSKTFEFDTNGKVKKGNVRVDISKAQTASDVRDLLRQAIDGVPDFQIRTDSDGTDGIVVINKDLGKDSNKAIAKNVADAGFLVQGMQGGKPAAEGRDFTKEDWNLVRIYRDTGAGQVAKGLERGKGWIKITGSVFNTTSRVASNTVGNEPALYTYLGVGNPQTTDFVPKEDGWFKEPDQTSRYIVATSSKNWFQRVMIVGQTQQTPALMSVYELQNEQTLRQLNLAAQAEINRVVTGIREAMGNDAKGAPFLQAEDFVRVPVVYMGQWDGKNKQLTHPDPKTGKGGSVAYTPNLANFQPANGDLIVLPRVFGPQAAGQDSFQKAASSAVGAGVTFADVWDLWHRQDGEVHCATEVTRDIFAFNWWEKQP